MGGERKTISHFCLLSRGRNNETRIIDTLNKNKERQRKWNKKILKKYESDQEKKRRKITVRKYYFKYFRYKNVFSNLYTRVIQ